MAARQATTPKPLPHSQNRLPGVNSLVVRERSSPYTRVKSQGTKPGTWQSRWKRSMRRSASRRKERTSAGILAGSIGTSNSDNGIQDSDRKRKTQLWRLVLCGRRGTDASDDGTDWQSV